MTEIVLFHHAQGLTGGVRSLAATLSDAGHTVHTPDTYDGKTFPDLESGLGYAQEVGFGHVAERGIEGPAALVIGEVARLVDPAVVEPAPPLRVAERCA